MINTQELRIGNYVLVRDLMLNKTMPARIAMIGGGRVQVDSEYAEVYHTCNAVSPIPLTSEILEKAGLERRFYGDYELTDELYVSESGVIYYRYWEGDGDRGGLEEQDIATVKYLHQLQNIYQALTGEELNTQL